MNFIYENDAIDLNHLFPFFLEIDESLCIRRVGRSLKKINPLLEESLPFESCFSIIRPWSVTMTFQGVLDYSSQLFILKDKAKDLVLRGQFLHLPNQRSLLFLGTPWITESTQLTQYSLHFHDFSLSDSFTDMIQLLRVNEINTTEIKSLVEDLHRQKQKIEDKETSYRQLVENATDIIFRCNAAGIITYINPATYKITEYTAEEIIGHKIYNIVAPEFREEIRQALQNQVQNKVANISLDYIVYHKKGHPIWLSQNNIAIFENDQVVGFTSIARDITYKKEIEKELLLSRKKALELVVAREQFLANTSHEIRTPMNAIIGLSDLLKDTPLTEKQKEYVYSIHTSAENLLVIINDILDLSKIEAGKLTLETIHFDLQDKLSILIRSMQIKALEKNLYLDLRVDTHLCTHVKGDPYRLNQILMNLLSNALKFTEKGSVILRVELAEEQSNRQVIRFRVEDTGIGIAPDKLQYIFDDFTQADASTTRKYGGTGLGLSISRKLAELMKGSLSVTSQVGAGSAFILELPLEKGVPMLQNKKSLYETSPNLLQHKTVLLVEDNEFNQLLASTILEQWNTKVTIARHGQEAVEKVKMQEFDVILMDIQMPVMGGVEATRIIRNELSIHTPIIALTANAIVENVKEYIDNGMNACVTKPFQREKLFEVIHQVLTQAKNVV
jgi:PAS domain S-box-containing protein